MMALDHEAAAYVQTHGLEDFLSAAVDAAIKARADDPLAYISAYLAPGSSGGSRRGGGGSLALDLHVKARSQENPTYPKRDIVSDEMVRWSARWDNYRPTLFTDPFVLKNSRDLDTGFKWADPPDVKAVREELDKRITYCKGGVEKRLEDVCTFDADGCPRNPVGRTGMCGRGLLGKWGPNHAADPIVTRYHPETGALQVVAIQRKDTRQWAIPGGMVDAGETVSVAVKREFIEEAGDIEDPVEREQFQQMIHKLFEGGRQVYRGYVDDPRVTDNAWIETTAFHFHCAPEIGDKLPLKAGDDAGQVMWLDVSTSNPTYRELYGSHRALIDEAIWAAWSCGDLEAGITKRPPSS